MSEVAVRRAMLADLGELVRLVRLGAQEHAGARDGATWQRHNARGEPLDDALAGMVRDGDHVVLVGEFDGVSGAVATAELRRDRVGERFAMIHDLYVEPDLRALGIGEVLLDHVIAWARERGALGLQALVLPGNREGKNFFERAGMKARLITVYRSLDGDG